VLYAAALHNKDIQGPDIADILSPQPAHDPLWFGPIEAGDTRRFIANGYVHVIAQPPGVLMEVIATSILIFPTVRRPRAAGWPGKAG
jgi:hypothetical protein